MSVNSPCDVQFGTKTMSADSMSGRPPVVAAAPTFVTKSSVGMMVSATWFSCVALYASTSACVLASVAARDQSVSSVPSSTPSGSVEPLPPPPSDGGLQAASETAQGDPGDQCGRGAHLCAFL